MGFGAIALASIQLLHHGPTIASHGGVGELAVGLAAMGAGAIALASIQPLHHGPTMASHRGVGELAVGLSGLDDGTRFRPNPDA